MNLEQFQAAWAQQGIGRSDLNAAQLRQQLTTEVRQRSRRILRIISVAAFLFVVGWGVGLVAHFTGVKPFNRVTLTTFLVMSLFDAGFLVAAIRRLQGMKREAAEMGGTVAEALRTSLRTVERQMHDCMLFGWGLIAVFTLNVAVTLVHYFTGNLPGRGMAANLALTVLFVVGIAVTLRRYRRERLVPDLERLRRALADFDGGNG